MQTVLIEVEHDFNWGKFCVARFDYEWAIPSSVSDLGHSLLAERGWTPDNIWVLDLETREGACFRPGGYAKADMDKHKIWCCPMFEPFLAWLYTQDLSDLSKLQKVVRLTEKDVAGAMHGYRHQGPKGGSSEQA